MRDHSWQKRWDGKRCQPHRGGNRPAALKVLAGAFRWLRMLKSGRFSTINDLAGAEKINASCVTRVLRLTLLAPDIVEAILDGQQPEGVTLPGLMPGVEAEWSGRRGDSLR